MDENRTLQGKAGQGHAGTLSVRQRVSNWHALFNCLERLEGERTADIPGPIHGFEFYRFAASNSRLPSLTFSCPRSAIQSDCLKVIVQLQGECSMRSGGKEATMLPSEWTFHNHSSDLEITLTPDAEQLHFLFPADVFSRKLLSVAPRVVSLGARAGVPRLAGGFLRLLSSEWPFLGASDRTDMIYAAAQLVQLAMTEQQTARRMTMQETLRERVKAHIARNLRDHGLTIDRIADALGCTKRNLHKVFRDDTHTLSAYIWDLRLQRCAADFMDPSRRHQTITQVAFSWGFNDAAHFSRLFRARYGVSASEFRAGTEPGSQAGAMDLSANRRRQGRVIDSERRAAAH